MEIKELDMIVRKASIYDSIGITKVYVETMKTAYRGIIDQDYLENINYDKQKRNYMNMLNKESLIFVSESKIGEIIGFSTPEVDRNEGGPVRGIVSSIYVLDRYQGEGIGYSLLEKSAKVFVKSEIKTMIVWVLKDNPACGFCEALGGKPKETRLDQIGGVDYVSIGYVWEDIERDFLFREN